MFLYLFSFFFLLNLHHQPINPLRPGFRLQGRNPDEKAKDKPCKLLRSAKRCLNGKILSTGGFNASGAVIVMGILNTLKRPWNLIYACEFLCLLLYVCFIINDLLIVFFIVEIEVILFYNVTKNLELESNRCMIYPMKTTTVICRNQVQETAISGLAAKLA